MADLRHESTSFETLLAHADNSPGRVVRITGYATVRTRRRRRRNLYFISASVGSESSSFALELKCKLRREGVGDERSEPSLGASSFTESFERATAGAAIASVEGVLEVFGGPPDDWLSGVAGESGDGGGGGDREIGGGNGAMAARRCRWGCGDPACPARTGGPCPAEVPVLRCSSIVWASPVSPTAGENGSVGAGGGGGGDVVCGAAEEEDTTKVEREGFEAPWLLFDMVYAFQRCLFHAPS